MADKLQSYMELAKQTTSRITQNLNQWKSFLKIVARFYKYEYYEQLLIYAQRPDAIACADYATWKNRMRRWVKRGAKGIALIDYKGDRPQLRYVFDISDTDGNENSRPVWQWRITKENQNVINEVMGQYLDRPLNSLTDTLIKRAEQLAVEYYMAHKDDIQIALGFSGLKRYNKDEQEIRFCQLAQSSIAYVLLFRCGYNADEYIDIEQFETINEFSEFLVVSALGVCTRYSAEQVLRQIERAAMNVIRERRNNHERIELHPSGGLSISRPENDGTAKPDIGQIRADAPRLSEATSRNSVRDNENSRDVIPSPIGSRSYRESESRTNNQGNGEVGERERGVESQRPNDMGESDEQSQKRSRGNRPARTDLQLSEKRETADNLSAVFSVSSKHVGRTLLEPTHRASESSGQISLFQLSPHELSSSVQLSLFGNADKIPQQIIDEVLCLGGNEPYCLEHICAFFAKDFPLESNALFLFEEYGTTGKGFYSGDRLYSIWFDAVGIRIAEGRSARYENETLLTWEEAAGRIRELLDMGRFVPQEIIDRAPVQERKEIADNLLYLSREIEDWNESGFMPTIRKIYDQIVGFPEMALHVRELLWDSDNVQKIIDELNRLNEAYQKNRELLRFHYHQPNTLIEQLENLQRPHLSFHSEVEAINMHQFISDDEIDRLLTGLSGINESKLRIYFYYLQNHNREERINYLKDVYGTGGKGRLGFQEWHDSKGISYSRADAAFHPYDTILIKWNRVEKRIGELIRQGRYLTAEETSYVPEFERMELARMVSQSFHSPPEGWALPNTLDTDWYKRIEQIRSMLNSAEDTELLLNSVKTISDLTPDVNSNFELRRQVLQHLTEYQNGTFSLTGENMSPFPSNLLDKNAEPSGNSYHVVESDDGNAADNVILEVSDSSDKNDSERVDKFPQQENEVKESNEALPSPETTLLVKPHKNAAFSVFKPEIPIEQRHNYRISDMRLGNGTASERYSANIAAIQCLKQIEAEERLATPEEQEILSRYVGWGGLSDCFDERHNKYQELKSLLDEDEYSAARTSALTAFYTSPTIVKAMYQALAQMGFRSGNILEPSCATGNFIGGLPDSMTDSKIYGVEIDGISGRIARQLYPESRIEIAGFEDVELPDSFFDVAIGNVPFGNLKVFDRRYNKHNFLIHDYFFAKAIDKVRPGGVIAFITSNGMGGGTFDKQTDKARKYLAQRCELVGAIRLPSNAFTENAGTDITTDILFLQKLDKQRGMDADVPEWVNTSVYHESDYEDKDGVAHHQIITLNNYYLKHPEMVLGKHEVISGPFGPQLVCSPVDRPLSELLQKAIQNISAEIKPYEVGLPDNEDEAISADPNVRNYSYTVVDGNLYFRENSLMYPVHVSKTAENRIRGMIQLRDCTRRLIEYQTENYPDETIQAEQSELNRLYDDYVKHYGYISNQGNRLAFRDDSSYFLLCSLEIFDDEGNFKHKSDMFTKRTIRTHIPVTSVETASEALAVSISEKAKIDLEYMSELSKKTPDELEAELKGVIFRDVYCAEEVDNIPKAFVDLAQFPLVTADEYLSGNVRRKLRMVRALKKARPDLDIEENIKALEAVQPADLTAGEISVHIGATWVPPEIYRQFMFELLDTSKSAQDKIQVLYSKSSGEWNITNKSADSQNLKIRTTYGTMRMNAYHILESTLNLRTVRIFDIEVEDGKERRVYNRKQSAAAQDRQELIKSKFVDWIWKDIDRREQLCKLYNEQFNAIRPREYDGSHIKFVGMNPEITLRKHQLNAIAHILYGNNTLLAHAVGAGKTYEMVAAAMESKRLGLCTKSLIVVPNHITGQWASEWLQLYPSANILVADEKDFQTDNRKKFCARIATGDYDAVIIGHSQFEKIPISVERQKALLNQQIDEIMNGISDAEAADAEHFTVKQLERRKKNLEVKLKKLNDQSRKDSVVAFEELGIDRIFVDESHYYKNLFLVTKMHNVGGISQTDAQKSSDLFAKCRYLSEMTGGKGIVFATGTPISNSMTELYTIQRYLQYSALEEAGLLHFDEWASIFGETVTKGELAPEGTGFRLKTRFARFHNLPELMSIFKEVADIQTADMLNLPVPKANFHTEVVKPSELQKQTVKSLAERAEAIRNGRVEPWEDNMLKITNDGRKLALDMRLLNPLLPEDENGKVAVCAGNVYQIWDKTRDKKSTQLVFCDLSTPKNDGSYDVYNNLKQQLMNRGVPEEEIAFIHDAHTKVQKQALFAKVRSGQIRILMGSTQKMGAGTNVQDKLIALHDLDCPWRPSDLEQRMGRIVRQGNENSEVEIYRYVTEGTFDSYLYQLIENKQHFISQIMTSKSPARVAEDIDQASLNYAEIKALASGNPMIIEKCNLEIDVNKLQMLKSSYLNQKYELENLLVRTYPQRLKELEEQISGRERDVKLAKKNPKIPEGFPTMLIKGVSYSDKKDAVKALLTVCKEITDEQFRDIGQYRGFKMSMRYDSFSKNYCLSLKGELSYTVNIEGDVYGNITRIDNAIDGIGKAISVFQEERKSIEKQIDNAQEELNKPFIHDAELEEKLARLRVVNHTLSLDKIEQEADFNDFIAPLEQDNGQEALKEEMEFC